MTYRRLNISQRFEIQRQLQASASQSAIARRIGVHRSTVSNEIQRNSWKGKYQAHIAQLLTQARELRNNKSSKKRSPILSRQRRYNELIDFLKQKHHQTDRRKHRIRRRKEALSRKRKNSYRLYDWCKSEEAMSRRYVYLKRRKRNHWLENQLRRRRQLEDWQQYRKAPLGFFDLQLTAFYRKPSVCRLKGLLRGGYRPRDKWSDAWIERHLRERIRLSDAPVFLSADLTNRRKKPQNVRYISRPKRNFSVSLRFHSWSYDQQAYEDDCLLVIRPIKVLYSLMNQSILLQKSVA